MGRKNNKEPSNENRDDNELGVVRMNHGLSMLPYIQQIHLYHLRVLRRIIKAKKDLKPGPRVRTDVRSS